MSVSCPGVCVSVRTATIGIAWFCIVTSFIIVLAIVTLFVEIPEGKSQFEVFPFPDFDYLGQGRRKQALTLVGFYLLSKVVEIITSALLIDGARQKDPNLCEPWLAVEIFCVTIGSVILITIFHRNGHFSLVPSLLTVWLVIRLGFLTVVYEFRRWCCWIEEDDTDKIKQSRQYDNDYAWNQSKGIEC